MALGRRIARFFIGLLIVLGLALWVVALLLFTKITEPSDDFASNAIPILLINAIGVAVLLSLIGKRLFHLIRDYRRFVPGSRLQARVVSLLIIVSAAPLVILYIFSVLFIAKGIDEWFPIDVPQGLEDAVALTNTALELRQQDDLAEMRRISGRFVGVDAADFPAQLASVWPETSAVEIGVYAADGRRIMGFSRSGAVSGADSLSEDALVQLQASDGGAALGHAYLELLPDDTHEVRASVPIGRADGGVEYLSGRFPLPVRINDRFLAVQGRQGEFLRLEESKAILEIAFTLSLSLVLLVAILAAVYAAFFFAERLISPIQQLMQGTRAVARGDFDTKVPIAQRDEIGFLVNSFNNMTQRLASARQEARESEQRREEARKSLEVILARLTTGVVSVEQDLTIRTANRAAGEILGVELEAHIGESLHVLAETRPLLGEFLSVARRHLDAGRTEWREQISLRGELGQRELVCACTDLPTEGDGSPGYVIVFDDITVLMQAQREAAWGEVARRLAHEIKNPLTPIQLSAERVRRRFLIEGNDDLDLLDRATHTIIEQVDAMKGMVDAFSEYARTPDIELSRLNLNALIGEVTELYRHQATPVVIRMNLDDSLPEVDADIGRLRQVMHNLMRNASEAVEGQADAEIGIETHRRDLPNGEFVEISVTDNGPGFAEEIIGRAFLPYVTSKAKGTGLGLAIVRKLVEEHGGTIRARNKPPRGAEVSILLPLSGAGRGAGVLGRGQRRRKRA